VTLVSNNDQIFGSLSLRHIMKSSFNFQPNHTLNLFKLIHIKKLKSTFSLGYQVWERPTPSAMGTSFRLQTRTSKEIRWETFTSPWNSSTPLMYQITSRAAQMYAASFNGDLLRLRRMLEMSSIVFQERKWVIVPPSFVLEQTRNLLEPKDYLNMRAVKGLEIPVI
jgi:hypothetical protein